MVSKVMIEKNAYYDSVTLMSLSGKTRKLDGVKEAVISMATPMNKNLLDNIGLLTDEAAEAAENDLLIAVQTDSDERAREIIDYVKEQLHAKKDAKRKDGVRSFKTLKAGLNHLGDANMAVISVPGEYAAREARQAIRNGLHVMLFSDNVSIEDERDIKEMGRKAGLLVMGPDCGTALINQIGLCFANNVNPGNIGLVAASGTGLQEVTVQIDRLGYGISQGIGTGGRDLHESIGGIMMLEGLKALERDEQTELIVLISKPPAASVQDKILTEVKACRKPVVVCFIDGDPGAVQKAGATFASTLMDAAQKAVLLVDPHADADKVSYELNTDLIHQQKQRMSSSQKYIRGLYCGGTLAAESLAILREFTDAIQSNAAKKPEEKLKDVTQSQGHTLLDLGDDAFTVGRPHPMIEPSLRNERIVQEAKDPETAVLLMDFVLGFGAHEDPAGVTMEAIQEAKQIAEENGRHLPIVGYILGTVNDKQGYTLQEKQLKAAGVLIARSNEEAAKLAAQFI